MSDAATFKAAGNKAFSAGDFETAVAEFTKAIEASPEDAALYSNKAAALTKLGTKGGFVNKETLAQAAAAGDKAIELKPEWAKGYSRKASALFFSEDYAQAVKVYAEGLGKDPSDKLLTDGLQQAQKALQEQVRQAQRFQKQNEDVVIGIDLGTTYSCVSVWQDDQVVIVPNNRGEPTTPSYVAFDPKNGKRLLGQAAKSQAARWPKNVIYDIKRIIGQRWSDQGVETDADSFPFRVVKGDGDKPIVEVDIETQGVRRFAPEELSAMVLGHLKKQAEKFLNKPVGKAVITVPAYFNDAQRNATKAAGRIAGLEVLRIINEPTAAALSYGLDLKAKEGNKNVLVFDLGGGTFDVSLLSVEKRVFKVLATGGDTRLGGEDVDNNILKHLLADVEAQGIADITGDDRAVKRLRVAGEKAKRELSVTENTVIELEALIAADEDAGIKQVDFKTELSRAKFEKLNDALFLRCIETVKRVLKDATLKPEDIDEVVLVGGSTRIPKLQQMLQATFFGKEPCRSVNPDEAVSYGAAVQGAILNGLRTEQTEDLLLVDVTPLSLGIETTGKVMSVIIPRNSAIPCVKTQVYTTEENYQTQVDISVYEGERLKSDENNLLGQFTISGIERAKRGEPKVNVSFALDSNGILTVTAKDQKTGAEANITITNDSRASEEDIQKMMEDAEKYRRDDEQRSKRIEGVNEIEALMHQAEEALMTLGSDVPADAGRRVRGGRMNAQQAHNKAINDLSTALEQTRVWVDSHAETAKLSDVQSKKRVLEGRLNRVTN